MKKGFRIAGIGLVILVGTFLLLIGIVWYNQTIHFYEYAHFLSGEEETVELMYLFSACGCAEWVKPEDFQRYRHIPFDTLWHKAMYIEAEQADVKVPNEYLNNCCGNRIKFTGRFYWDQGISRNYEQYGNETPDKARVFRYSHYELVKPYTAWDYSTQIDSTGPKMQIIE